MYFIYATVPKLIIINSPKNRTDVFVTHKPLAQKCLSVKPSQMGIVAKQNFFFKPHNYCSFGFYINEIFVSDMA